ncbi:Predicted phospholipase, patatin/cPLA2 family [Tenacibaculum mesophilum]|uniref:Patatin-like phospholipase family protein n=1 Tax=Tenacibaculum mesophilum TaxID=104268 RepID=A0AAE9SEE1_9FLAO|nr:patatin-like phospholipase family protein [Tenacibaculum mesophilum]AZJ31574.1 patatin-like phospholipase family protein [Tenacibaculum mesophilum]QFS29622.1 patatin-like phospholipase family protein [Tenacibaculum mesophilum]UTD14247.1 patatin-like phospholipase family protein [Tenacibaculum mesophilum]SHG00276.1 Predicted phospholipase, patatin/cPLA2 family [Tenacibaculum mesophilum]
MKKALVISGGGSKGAFAGGVAQYLMKNKNKDYDMLLGTSTGSLMVSHLALGMIDELKEIYTSVDQKAIFSNSPFRVKSVHGEKVVSIRHRNTIWNFLNGRKTFGESKNLRKLISKSVTKEMYDEIRRLNKEVVVTVSNLTANQIEYKSILECEYEDFCDWIWGSCNYVPFMSLLEKDHCQYADGGFGSLIPIREAIARGATEVDAIILATEVTQMNRLPAKNPFSLMMDTFDFMLENVERHNITIGKLSAKQHNVKLNLYYTPTVLTTNSLVFDKEKMKQWWKSGYKYAKKLNDDRMTEFRPEMVDNQEIEEGIENSEV